MKTVFSSHSEVAHIWAQQKQEKGKANNVFFEGPTIYSWGRHFKIAEFVKPNVVLFNNDTYSPSTSKHQCHVRRAIPGTVKVFWVPFVGDNYHNKNLQHYLTSFNNSIYSAHKAIKYTASYVQQAEAAKESALQYIQEFNLQDSEIAKQIESLKVDESLQVKIIAQEKRQFEREEKERLRREARYTYVRNNHVEPWLKGEFHQSVISELPEIYLRAKNNEVQTSHGAKVPLKDARVLYQAIKSNRDIKGYEIGSFTVIGINGVLKIGCHEITRTEIERFASSQNWSKEEV
jgi:hypothetical protein